MRRISAITAVCIVAVVATAAGWLISTATDRRSDEASDRRTQRDVAPWVLLGADTGSQSLEILLLAASGSCEHGTATVSADDKGYRVRASIVDTEGPCELAGGGTDPTGPIAVPLPTSAGELGGPQIDGPGFRGAATAEQRRLLDIKLGTYPRRSYPSVEGLTLDQARSVLERAGAAVQVVGPTVGYEPVGIQSPPPGSPVAPWLGKPREATEATLPTALLFTGGDVSGPDRVTITCRQADRLDAGARLRLKRLASRCVQ